MDFQIVHRDTITEETNQPSIPGEEELVKKEIMGKKKRKKQSGS